jgi:hypothetical protein
MNDFQKSSDSSEELPTGVSTSSVYVDAAVSSSASSLALSMISSA